MKAGIRIFCFLLIINLISLSLIHAQDLTGIWRGHFRGNDAPERLAGNNDDRYKMEVQIAQTKNHFEAVTYSYKSYEFYGKADAMVTLNAATKKVLLKEGKLIEVRALRGGACPMTCFLKYSKLGDDEYLQGTYYSTNEKDSTIDCGKGTIFLHRVTESEFHKEPFLEKREKELLALKKASPPVEKPSVVAAPVPPVKKAETPTSSPALSGTTKKSSPKNPPAQKPLVAQKKSSQVNPEQSQNTRDNVIEIPQNSLPANVPFVLKSRTNELLKTLTVSNSNIELRIYDDGAIDNDTVSVYYDNVLIVSKARLTDQPIIVHIKVEPSEHPHQLVMVAENLGDIPPNTSLLVVKDGEKSYEERIISTEQKNVQVNFLSKKTE
jgi:hypothetical protein